MPDEAGASSLVELARRTVEAQNAGDIDALIGLYMPEAVWDAVGYGLVGERFEGSAAIRRFFEDWFGAFDDMRLDAEETCDLGNGVVFSHFVQHARPHGSSNSMSFSFATVSTWSEGLIRENRVYTDIDEARAAAERLSEERGLVATDATASVRIDSIRNAFDAVKCGDWDRATRFLAPGAVWESEGFGSFQGRAAIRDFWQDWIGSFDQFEVEFEDVVDVGSGVLFVVLRLTGRPLEATGTVQSRQGWIYVWCGETVTRVVTKEDVEEARAAAERLAEERE